MNHYDVIIVGGGVVGAGAAHRLAQSSAKTLLIDSRDAGRATDAGAGIIGPETGGIGIAPDWYQFAMTACGYYPTLIGQLEQDGAGDTGYQVCGELIVAVDEDELDAYEERKRIVFERQRARNHPTPDDLREVSPDEACALFPALKRPLKALYFRGAARVDGRLLSKAMLTAAQNRGLRILKERVEKLVIEDNRVTGVQVNGDVIRADKVIIAGGAWSASFGDQLGCTIPVEPQRGQIIHLRLPNTDTSRWPIVEAFHSHYLVCWPDGRVVAGATRETGSGFASTTSAAGVHQVLDEALRVAPGLSEGEIGEIRVGLRPRTVDNLPVMGGVPGIQGIFLATGHGGTGLQLGPYSGKLAAEWALENPPSWDSYPAFGVNRWEATA
jgi:glycine/D-amino acid oxidase-like deaminating enzyme